VVADGLASEGIFVCGLSLISSALRTYRDMVRGGIGKYDTVLLVPIFYSFTVIPPAYTELYQLNPVAALVWRCATSFGIDPPPVFS
jgi:ABC-type polysaccharide/polyol phosphate export permease